MGVWRRTSQGGRQRGALDLRSVIHHGNIDCYPPPRWHHGLVGLTCPIQASQNPVFTLPLYCRLQKQDGGRQHGVWWVVPVRRRGPCTMLTAQLPTYTGPLITGLKKILFSLTGCGESITVIAVQRQQKQLKTESIRVDHFIEGAFSPNTKPVFAESITSRSESITL